MPLRRASSRVLYPNRASRFPGARALAWAGRASSTPGPAAAPRLSVASVSSAPCVVAPPRERCPPVRCSSAAIAAGTMGSEQSSEAESRPNDLNSSGRCPNLHPPPAGPAPQPRPAQAGTRARERTESLHHAFFLKERVTIAPSLDSPDVTAG